MAQTPSVEPWREPDLSVLIVNYRTPGLSIDCLASLEPELADLPGMKVILVDNASGDDSVERIGRAIDERGWGDWARLVPQQTNYGFAGGNNRAQEVLPDARHFLMLNSDTVVHRGCLKYCYDLLEAEPTIGAMSCLLLNADRSVQNVTRRFPHPARAAADSWDMPNRFPRAFRWADMQDLHWDRRTLKRDVDWIGGAFVMVRGSLVREVGLLDEDFFFYGEDIEFSHRIWQSGYRVHYDPAVSITHFGGGSSGSIGSRTRSEHAWSGRYKVQRKCYGRLAEEAARATDAASWASKAVWRRLRKGGDSEAYAEARDVVSILAGRP